MIPFADHLRILGGDLPGMLNPPPSPDAAAAADALLDEAIRFYHEAMRLCGDCKLVTSALTDEQNDAMTDVHTGFLVHAEECLLECLLSRHPALPPGKLYKADKIRLPDFGIVRGGYLYLAVTNDHSEGYPIGHEGEHRMMWLKVIPLGQVAGLEGQPC